MISKTIAYSLLKLKPQFTIFIPAVLLLTGCSHDHLPRTIERSFYYWKTVFKLTAYEKQRLESLQVKNIYIRFFDVDWDAISGNPIPKAPVKIIDSVYIYQHRIKIIPVVFITNECLQKIDSAQINLLAVKIISLLKTSFKNTFSQQSLNELQIDCDWSSATKQKYFSLLRTIKQSGVPVLSVTIRLHQIKYFQSTGVPPADRGLLMCYNMGNLLNPATKNSIIEAQELKKYIIKLVEYPLQLDIGLPLFEWYVLFRNNKFNALIKILKIDNNIKKIDNAHYFILKDTLINEVDFKKGDILRREESSYAEILKVETLLNKNLNNSNIRISLFHLDSVTLKKYPTHELENIYNFLH